MSMRFSLRRAATTVAAVGALALVGTVATPVAFAAPAKVGAVTGLAVDLTKPTDGPYELHATWNPATNAAEYRIKLVDVSTATTLQSVTLPAPAVEWETTTSLPAGTSLKVTVTAANGKRKGKPATKTVGLPDLTAPTGVYELTGRVVTTVTVTERSLSDDLTPAPSIARAVRWGDEGDVWHDWASGTTELQHAYPVPSPGETELYTMTVRVSDAAAPAPNSATYDLQVRIGDESAPTGGGYDAAPGAAWATLTDVALTETVAPTDDFSPSALTRAVKWGDAGNVWEAWPVGQTITHRYAAAGDYTPVVRVTDEALNGAEFTADQVTVSADAVAPVVKINVPKTGADSAAKWATVRGKASDTNGTGVLKASVRAVEKRGSSWYAYKPGKQKWVKAGTTQAAALAKAPWFNASLAPTGAWSASLVGLKLGVLVVQARAKDLVGNTSAAVSKKQRLTR
jgi:hypothetical protein